MGWVWRMCSRTRLRRPHHPSGDVEVEGSAIMRRIASTFIALCASIIPLGAQQWSGSTIEIDIPASLPVPNQPLGDTFISCLHGRQVTSRTPPRRKLGIAYAMRDEKFMATQRVPVPTSAYVSVVEPGSIAGIGGIRTGDLILRIGGAELLKRCDLADAVARIEKGSRVSFEIWRDDNEIMLPIQF